MIQAKINPVPILAMLVLGGVLAIVASCGKGMPDPTFVYENEGNLIVDNRTKGRFVLFCDNIAPGKVIGGVPGHTNGFRLKTAPKFQVVRAVSVEEYVKNRKDIAMAKPVQMYLVDVSSPVVLTITNQSPMSGYVYFVNERDAYIEIRDGSWAGPRLTVLSPLERGPQYVGHGNKVMYPVVVASDAGYGKVVDVTRLSNSIALRFVGNSTNVSVRIRQR